MSDFPSLKNTNKLAIYILIIACIIAFLPAFSSEYLDFDDYAIIIKNPLFRMPLSLESLQKIFCGFYENQYTPLSIMTFWLEYNIFGFNSFISHLINFLIHLFGSFAVYFLLYYLLKNKVSALILSLIWSIHPMQAESVVWVTGRRSLMYGSFFFASIAFYLRHLETGKKADKYLATIMMVLSGLSKTLAFSVPFVWLAIDYLKGQKISISLIKDKFIGFIISLALIIIMLIAAKSGINTTDSKELNFLEASYAVSYYPLLTAIPHGLTGTNELNAYTQDVVKSGYFYLSIYLAISIWLATQSKLALFALFFYLFHIIPMSGLIRVGYPFYLSYHFCYVAQLGIILQFYELVKLLNDKWMKPEVFKQTAYAIAIIIMMVYGIQTYYFSDVWQNSEKLFSNSLSVDPNNIFARFQLCSSLEKNRRFDEVAFHSQELIKRHADFYGGYYKLSEICIFQENPTKALKLLNKAQTLEPEFSDRFFQILNKRSYCYYKLQKYEESENDLNIVINKYNSNIKALSLRAKIRHLQGKYDMANEDYKAIDQLQPLNMENKTNWFINNLKSYNIIECARIVSSALYLLPKAL